MTDDSELSDNESDYPQELLDASYIEDSVYHLPVDAILDSIKELLQGKNVSPETERHVSAVGGNLDLVVRYFIADKSQQELFDELREHPNPDVSEGAKHLDPQWKPRTKSTYEVLQTYARKAAELDSMTG